MTLSKVAKNRLLSEYSARLFSAILVTLTIQTRPFHLLDSIVTNSVNVTKSS
jgi:hypothetical protein